MVYFLYIDKQTLMSEIIRQIVFFFFYVWIKYRTPFDYSFSLQNITCPKYLLANALTTFHVLHLNIIWCKGYVIIRLKKISQHGQSFQWKCINATKKMQQVLDLTWVRQPLVQRCYFHSFSQLPVWACSQQREFPSRVPFLDLRTKLFRNGLYVRFKARSV